MARLSKEETKKLLELYKNHGNKDAFSKLVEYNLGLVKFFCTKYKESGLSYDDMYSIGSEALVRAIMLFQIEKGCDAFSSYISITINYSIINEIKKYNKRKSFEKSLEEPIGSSKDGDELRLEDILGTDPNKLTDDVIEEMKIDVVRESLKCLTHREQQIILLRYGLDDKNRKTQEEVAKYFDCTPQAIAYQEKKAIMKMRHPRNTKKLKDFVEDD